MANAVVTVLEADGTTETDVTILDVGRQAAAASKSLTLATEDKAVLDALKVALEIIDNIVSGSEAQVDVVAALPTGTNSIGRVDVDSLPSDPLGANADAASATGSISAKLKFIAQTGIPVTSNALPTGASTAAKQDTVIGHLDGVEGLLATIDGDTGDIKVAVELIDDAIKTDDAAFTPATTKVMMAGFEADETATDSVDEGDAGAARMTLDRKVIVTAQPHTAGGFAAPFKSLDLDETEEDVKTSAGQLYGMYVVNRTTAPLYLRFYNATAANVTVGTTAHLVGPLEIPANASDHIGASIWFGGMGVPFDTAISVSATTGFADNDVGAPAANACIINVFYK